AHVGYHLVGDGRRGLEADIGYRPRGANRFRRLVLAAPAAFYFGSVGTVTALLLALGVMYARAHGASMTAAFWIALLLLISASEVALAFVQRLVALFIPPRRLMRLDFRGGLPPHTRTMVIVPVMLTSLLEVEELLERLEIMAIGNIDPFVHFA